MPEAKKVICPECDKEVDLSQNDGVCQNCNLDVGQIVETDRHQRALQKYRERRESEDPNKKDEKKKRKFSLM